MAKSTHGTLTAGTVTSVSITPGEEGIVVINRDLAGEIWVRIDDADPAIAGDGSYVVIGSREFPLSRKLINKQIINVRLISNAGRKFSVEAIQ